MSGEHINSNILIYFFEQLPELYKANLPTNAVVPSSNPENIQTSIMRNIQFRDVIYCNVCDEITPSADFTLHVPNDDDFEFEHSCFYCTKKIILK